MKVEEGDGGDGRPTRSSRFKPGKRHNYSDHCKEISNPTELQVKDSTQFVHSKRANRVANDCDVSPYARKEELHHSAVAETGIENGVVHYAQSMTVYCQ